MKIEIKIEDLELLSEKDLEALKGGKSDSTLIDKEDDKDAETKGNAVVCCC